MQNKNKCICVDCHNKCYEYENNITSDKAYYEWTYKEDKCKAESEKHLMQIVTEICNTQSANCRSLNKSDLARQIMDYAHVPSNAEIQEIPLDWNNQVCVLFLIPQDTNYYSLYAGIGTDGNFHFDLYITGKLKGNTFDFYDEEKPLPIDYFTTK